MDNELTKEQREELDRLLQNTISGQIGLLRAEIEAIILGFGFAVIRVTKVDKIANYIAKQLTGGRHAK